MSIARLYERRARSWSSRRPKWKPELMELEMRRLLSNYVVNDPGDAPLDSAIGAGETATGTITLRSAIEQINIDGGGEITFDGSMSISVNSALDPITAPDVTIDGLGVGPVVISGASGYDGLVIKGGGATIEGIEVSGFLVGITLQSSQNTISDDTFGAGLYSIGGEVQEFSGNVTAGIEDAIGNNTIENDTVTGNLGAGIILDGASQDQVESDQIESYVFYAGGQILTTPGNGAGIEDTGGNNTIQSNYVYDNLGAGIILDGASQDQVYSNTIDGNNGFGLEIDNGASNNTIGGLVIYNGQAVPSNYFESNDGNNEVDVDITGAGTSGNLVEGNQVDNMNIVQGASDNTIGGTVSAAANNIGGNVVVGSSKTDTCEGDAILGNQIEGSIDLGDDGVTLNDSSGHSGPNLFQNFPVLSSSTSSGVVQITGSLSAAPDTTYRIEFFHSYEPSPSGYGPGVNFITFENVTTDSSGTADFTAQGPDTFDPPMIPGGADGYITATATDPAGNTSEFSLAIPDQYIPPLIVNDPGDAPLDPSVGPGETYAGTITLRSAIEQVNIDALSGIPSAFIGFASPMDITVYSQLDTITAPGVTIDGTTYGGDVELSGSSGFDGLVLGASGDTIENLNIQDFINGIDDDSGGSNVIQDNTISGNTGDGINIQGASNDQILANSITSNLDDGVAVSTPCCSATATALENVIGAPGEGNLISGNGTGVALLVSNDNLIQGNYIGTDDTGELAFGNGVGISLGLFSFGNTIGGTSYGAGNVISGNGSDGISLDLGDNGPLSSEPGNVIQGNLIGLDATGTKAIANGEWGIALSVLIARKSHRRRFSRRQERDLGQRLQRHHDRPDRNRCWRHFPRQHHREQLHRYRHYGEEGDRKRPVWHLVVGSRGERHDHRGSECRQPHFRERARRRFRGSGLGCCHARQSHRYRRHGYLGPWQRRRRGRDLRFG